MLQLFVKIKSLDDLEMGGSQEEKRRIAKLNAYKMREEWYELYLDDFTMVGSYRLLM